MLDFSSVHTFRIPHERVFAAIAYDAAALFTLFRAQCIGRPGRGAARMAAELCTERGDCGDVHPGGRNQGERRRRRRTLQVRTRFFSGRHACRWVFACMHACGDTDGGVMARTTRRGRFDHA